MKKLNSKRLLIVFLGGVSLVVLVLGGILGFHLLGYYLSIGAPHDPGASGYTPVEEVRQTQGGFVMRRYRIEAHWLQRYLSGNPHERSDDGYDSVIVISDLSGKMLARIGHWEGDLEIVVTPEGVTGPNGIEWKAKR